MYIQFTVLIHTIVIYDPTGYSLIITDHITGAPTDQTAVIDQKSDISEDDLTKL